MSSIPKWFCGDAKEWDFVSRSAKEKKGSRLLRAATPKGYDPYDASMLPIETEMGAGGATIFMMLGGLAGLVGGPAIAIEGSPIMALITLGVVGGGIGGLLGWVGGAAVGGVSAMMVRGLVSPMREIFQEKRLLRLASEGRGIGRDRVKEIQDVAVAAREAFLQEGLKERADELAPIINGLERVLFRMPEEVVETEVSPSESEEEKVAKVIKALRTGMPNAYREDGDKGLVLARMEGLLAEMGETGADGLAAIEIWRGMGALQGQDEQERKLFLEERLPRLVGAYLAVPLEERKVENSVLDGETPEGSLRRGLASAMGAALAARRRHAESSAVRVEAEARVMGMK